MSDGDVARYNKSFSIRGSYWDSVIHSVINPLYYFLISYSFFIQFSKEFFLILGAFACLSTSVLMAVKNNYYKALYFNDKKKEKSNNANSNFKDLKYKTLYFFSEIMSIEGFVFLALFIRVFNVEQFALILILSYIFFNALISSVKFYQFSYYNKVFSKS